MTSLFMTELLGLVEHGEQIHVRITILSHIRVERELTFDTDPGCGVDIPAVLYSLSFAQNPDFSNWFPKHEEVLDYVNSVASRFDLFKHMVGNREWVGASWHDDAHTWLVQLRDLSTGQEYHQECKILISAVGALTNPRPFDMQGADRFQGRIFHTAEWDHGVSLDGKDVIVIGNGGNVVQFQNSLSSDTLLSICHTTNTGNRDKGSLNYAIC